MAGKSSWNLMNTVIALTLNIGLNLLLIPHLGITGAGIAWAASILANNLIPLAQDWIFLELHPFGRGLPKAVVAATVAYLGVGVLVRLTLGLTVPAFLIYGVVATGVYAALAWRFRDDLQLVILRDAIRPRRGRPTGARALART
jgi:O-antigen/teichoic acid export membrane protein